MGVGFVAGLVLGFRRDVVLFFGGVGTTLLVVVADGLVAGGTITVGFFVLTKVSDSNLVVCASNSRVRAS